MLVGLACGKQGAGRELMLGSLERVQTWDMSGVMRMGLVAGGAVGGC